MTSFASQMFAQKQKGDKAIELQNGLFRDEPLFGYTGEFRLAPMFGWFEQHVVRCNLELAQRLDSALSLAAKAGPISLPNPLRVRRHLIESGSDFSLGLAEPTWNDVGAMSVYRRTESGSRLWKPVALATQQQIAALAAQLLAGITSGDFQSAPLPSPQHFPASLISGLKPQTLNGLHLSADAECEFDAEIFPKSLLASTQVLARRIRSQEELDSLKEVA